MNRPSRPQPPSRPSAWSTVCAATRWLMLVALWLQVGLAPLMAATPTAWQAQLDGKMVVCTAAGMVILEADGQPASPQAEAGPTCVFCLPLLHGGVKAPPLVPQPLPMGGRLLDVMPPDRAAAGRPMLATGPQAPRAPPIR